MKPGTKLATYGLVLAAMVGGGAAVGSAVGPVDIGSSEEHGEDHGAEERGPSELGVSGLLVSQAGYTFEPAGSVLTGHASDTFRFVISGPDGSALQAVEPLHGRPLHLILVARDLSRFAHLHPALRTDGTWAVPLPELAPGTYRAYADFVPSGGEQLTLGADLFVPGAAPPPAEISPSRSSSVDGYDVTLDGEVTPGRPSDLAIDVRRNGATVEPDPYLGAAGHLVAIRQGDLAYLHVHPTADRPDPSVRFAIEVPSRGTYALFFDFLADGAVHTATFVLEVQPNGTPSTTSTTMGSGDGPHGH